MAARAVLRLHRRVDEGLLEDVLEGGVALQAGLADRAGLELELLGGGGRLGRRRPREGEDRGGEQEGEFPWHVGSSHFAGATWQASQERPANGACSTALKNLGSFEEWGLWQLMQLMFFGSMPRCAFPNLASFTS